MVLRAFCLCVDGVGVCDWVLHKGGDVRVLISFTALGGIKHENLKRMMDLDSVTAAAEVEMLRSCVPQHWRWGFEMRYVKTFSNYFYALSVIFDHKNSACKLLASSNILNLDCKILASDWLLIIATNQKPAFCSQEGYPFTLHTTVQIFSCFFCCGIV